MEAQTQKRRNSLRRTSILNAANSVHSPLRRNSSVFKSPVVVLERRVEDDETERSRRRSLVDIQRRVSSIPPASPLNEFNRLGEKEMKVHFQICTKLFAENKISSKNAWQLHIIDFLKLLSTKNTSDVLQVASTSLDISAKVYGIRVDDVYAEGLKLASTMARVTEECSTNNIDEEDCDSDMDGNAKKKKNSKKSRAPKNTIVKDLNNIIAPIQKLESVFFANKEDTQISAIDNFFTNTQPMHPSKHKIITLSKEKYFVSSKDPLLERKEIIEPPLNLTKFLICPPFKDFNLNNWDPDEEEKQMQAGGFSIANDNEIVYDENRIPIPELDGSIHDIFEINDYIQDGDSDVNDQHQDNICYQNQGAVMNIADIGSEDINRTDYSYYPLLMTQSGKVIDRLWAGPSHWKVKFNMKTTARYSGSVINQQVASDNRKKRKIKVAQPPDFRNSPIDKFNKDNKYSICRKINMASFDKITLPNISQSILKDFMNMEFLLKPGTSLYNKGKFPLKSDDCNVITYKYENPNDSEYCSQQNDNNDNDGVLNNDDDVIYEEHDIVPQNFVGDNLVEAPDMVEKTSVPYATQAKKMDMKKLKAAAWSVITSNTSGSDTVIEGMTFSQMYRTLPSMLNSSMKKELSCPLAFVALLHLCNEKQLKLTQDSNTDFTLANAQIDDV